MKVSLGELRSLILRETRYHYPVKDEDGEIMTHDALVTNAAKVIPDVLDNLGLDWDTVETTDRDEVWRVYDELWEMRFVEREIEDAIVRVWPSHASSFKRPERVPGMFRGAGPR